MTVGTPKLSIGLPVYNGARFLQETLDALLGQDFSDYELIVSDNASTDGTPEILEQAARRDPRITWSRNERNLGATRNLTLVFERARAPFFKWACADDVLEPGFLSAGLEALERHPEAVAVYGGVTLIDAEGAVLGPHEQGLDLRSSDAGERFFRVCEYVGLLHVLQGVMRSDALRRCAPHGAYVGSDEVLVSELALAGQIHEIPAPMLRRRMHPESGNAGSLQQQLAHLDPSRPATASYRYWRHAFGHLGALLRAPLVLATRLRLIASTLRRMVENRDHLGRELATGVRRLISRA